ncbi:signal peptidase I [Brevundimonas sp. SPF441]|jgi:conjugal transfer pilin signal peptidase TrbI|uniref:signal peptidase I n=1 Tax=Brevundimonas TaxID=41275 RepID=UPI00129D919A|nr:signal peptidase I [Brevundimonas sp. SPF441]MRL68903.1 signal peptidase I [Brevundimonas sp. SPF441]
MPLEPDPNPPSWRRVGMLVLFLGGVLAWKGGEGVSARYGFGINVTESLPHWAFITDRSDKAVARGDLVEFVAPPTPYYPEGQRFVKRVAGVAGDRVETQARNFYVAGKLVGAAKERARSGEAAPIGPTGVIPEGRIFVVGDHVDSLDSRYAAIGWISADRIIGKVEPIL